MKKYQTIWKLAYIAINTLQSIGNAIEYRKNVFIAQQNSQFSIFSMASVF